MKNFGDNLIIKEDGGLYFNNTVVHVVEWYKSSGSDEEYIKFINNGNCINKLVKDKDRFQAEFFSYIKESSEAFKKLFENYNGKIRIKFDNKDYIAIVDSEPVIDANEYDIEKINFYLRYCIRSFIILEPNLQCKLKNLFMFNISTTGNNLGLKFEKIGFNLNDFIDFSEFVNVLFLESVCCKEEYNLIKNGNYIVLGDTYDVRDRLKKAGCKFLKCGKNKWHIYISKNNIDDFKNVFSNFYGEYKINDYTISVYLYKKCFECGKKMLSYKLIYLKDCNGVVMPFCSECAREYRGTSWNDRCFA